MVLNRLFQETLDFIFPPCCAGCGRVDHAVCPSCAQSITHDASPIIRPSDGLLSGSVSTGWHEGILRECVVTLKDTDPEGLVAFLAARMHEALQQTPWADEPTRIVPVPLHARRLRERGFNQSERLADVLSVYSHIAPDYDSLSRLRNTPHQVGLSGGERRQNVLHAFSASRQAAAGQTILLVDDVFTTGATLQACAAALLEAGAQAVFGITVSAAVDHSAATS
ncbi:MAG: ComF family protein [Pleurocapsa minor GSE-CHR-MK-17-07R]|jgi:ComF family protein|nr:ComF family protein [Pleurocapsa minor GSE-CHR-MK 17-07R]